MNTQNQQHFVRGMLPIVVLAIFLVWHTPVLAQSKCIQGSTCVSINGSNEATAKEQARQSQQQWNETHRLRNKKNIQEEKDFDKNNRITDAKNMCERSTNINAYWENNTDRCLDRQTGFQIKP